MAHDMNVDELPDSTEMTDPYVIVHLTGGTMIELRDISIIEVTRKLMSYGFCYMGDGRGQYLVLFENGVTALQASSEPFGSSKNTIWRDNN